MSPKTRVGWREWVAFPDLGIDRIKAKVDTGARSSALHAFDVERFERDGDSWVRFRVHPRQRDDEYEVECEAPLVDEREVKSSTGRVTLRPVVLTHLEWMGERWEIELTLVRRDQMGFRCLVGRQAMRKRWIVDPAASYVGGRRLPFGTKKRRGEEKDIDTDTGSGLPSGAPTSEDE
ncbi:MAG TPA: RimK/LysX family protein [Longimicrobiales bacterium]|nr:RimK/LysX family protein [Longimicrobiales bacterium]